MENIIEIKNLTKRFPGIIANNNISLDIKKGEIFALLGENGAGKSVLMSMLFGMYEPDEGEIYIRGEKVTNLSPKKATELNLGMVHQHFKLVENFTVAENITLGIEVIKRFANIPFLDDDKMYKKIENLSKQFKLDIDPKSIIRDINVASRQKVEILKMLYREAEILIFDEPTAVLTPQEIDYLLKVILELRESGKTIILVTHKLEEIKRVADRFAVLNQGKLVGVQEVKNTSTKEMANMMVGRDVVLEIKKEETPIGDVVFEVQNLSVINEHKVKKVNNVSFKIREGEIFAIVGVGDNGQDEITDSITGLLPIKNGEIILKGENITNHSIRERAEAGISYIPQDRHNVGLILDFTLSENLSLKDYYKKNYCTNGFLQQEVFENNSRKLIKEYDIRSNNNENSIVRSMSGGNQQKAIIAREINQDNPFIIFSQPTRGLDIGAIENTRKQIIALKKHGKAILLVSLELDEVMELADTIGVIYNGEILKISDAKDLNINQIGEYMMGVKDNEKKK